MLMDMMAYFFTPQGELAYYNIPMIPHEACEVILGDFGRAIEALGWGKVVVLQCLPML